MRTTGSGELRQASRPLLFWAFLIFTYTQSLHHHERFKRKSVFSKLQQLKFKETISYLG